MINREFISKMMEAKHINKQEPQKRLSQKDMMNKIIRMKEDAPQILMSFGMGCVGCPSAQAETIEEAAYVHGIKLEELLEALNK